MNHIRVAEGVGSPYIIGMQNSCLVIWSSMVAHKADVLKATIRDNGWDLVNMSSSFSEWKTNVVLPIISTGGCCLLGTLNGSGINDDKVTFLTSAPFQHFHSCISKYMRRASISKMMHMWLIPEDVVRLDSASDFPYWHMIFGLMIYCFL